MSFIFDNKIEIIGDTVFEKNTKEALKILQTSDISSYDIVSSYIGIIKQNSYSGMDVFASKPTFLVANETSSSGVFWYASTIVHDAMHSFLFFRARQKASDELEAYINGIEAYSGHDAEMFCLTKQIETLKKIQAPEYLIKYAESCYNSDWYEIPISKRTW